MKGINLFLAHAPEDKEYRDKIGKHLSVLRDRGFINEYCISEVIAGSDADYAIRTLMNDAKIILLLISADFLASDDCRRLEDLAFSMKMRNDAIVVPVLLRSCMYDESYNQLQILPDNKKPISDKVAWADEDAALTNVAERIKQLVVKIRSEESPTPVVPQTNIATPVPPPAATPSETKPAIPWKIIAGVLGLALIGALFVMNPFSNSKSNTAKEIVDTPEDDAPAEEIDVTPEEKKPTPPVPKRFTVPNLQKSTWDQAVRKLEAAGIKNYSRVNEQSCSFEAGTVIKQRPAAGATVTEEEKINILVAESPKRISAASIRGSGKLHTLKNGGSYSQNAWALKTTNVEFSLEGTACSEAVVIVKHGLGGTVNHTLRAGQKKANSRFFGVGPITVSFNSKDAKDLLKLKIW